MSGLGYGEMRKGFLNCLDIVSSGVKIPPLQKRRFARQAIPFHDAKTRIARLSADFRNQVESDTLRKHGLSTFGAKVAQYRKPLKTWIGVDLASGLLHGSSVLLQVSKRRYAYVGSEIYTFDLREDVVRVASQLLSHDRSNNGPDVCDTLCIRHVLTRRGV